MTKKELIKRIKRWCKDFEELSNHRIGDETLEDEAYWIFQEIIKSIDSKK